MGILAASSAAFRSLEFFRRGEDLIIVAVFAHIIATIAEDEIEQRLLAGGGFLDDKVAFSIEHPTHATGFTEIPPILGENVPQLSDRTIAIVGEDAHKDRSSTGPVPLVVHLFIGYAGKFAGATHDGALDVLRRHVGRLSGVDDQTQPWIRIKVPASAARSDRHFLDQTGKNAPAFGISRSFFVFDRMPL